MSWFLLLLPTAQAAPDGLVRLTEPGDPVEVVLEGVRVGEGGEGLTLEVRVARDRWPGVVLRDLSYEVTVADAALVRGELDAGGVRVRRGREADLLLPVRLAREGALLGAVGDVLAGRTPAIALRGVAHIRVLGIPREVPFGLDLLGGGPREAAPTPAPGPGRAG